MNWKKLSDSSFKVKPHILAEGNIEIVQDYLKSNGSKPLLESEEFNSSFHHTQKRAVDWPKMAFNIGDKKLLLDVDRVTSLLWEMRLSKPQFSINGKVFHYSRNLNYVLTLDNLERDQLMCLLAMGRTEADQIAAEFTQMWENDMVRFYKEFREFHKKDPEYIHLYLPFDTKGN